MRKRRIILAALVLALLVGVVVVVWEVADWPPPRLILKYGFPPTGGPTGRTKVIAGIEFVELSPGYFRMGSHFGCEEGDLLGRLGVAFGLPWGTQPIHDGRECPPRWVEIDHPFWIAATEVTNAQYERSGAEGGRYHFNASNEHPVTDRTWIEANRYCAWLSDVSRVPVRLPSEAEWEFACRAGGASRYCFGDDEADLVKYAWFSKNSEETAHEVATRKANRWGLYDMHGNVKEWCEDTFDEVCEGAPFDPFGEPGWDEFREISDGELNRVYRGGGWDSEGKRCLSTLRQGDSQKTANVDIGFRPVFTLPEPK